ncbi:hypothetical protein [Halioxenophilus aromaticivorans]|uniref:DUF3828 domain-containing protein n=1 Tax=Halioxenophilus aromaticivorans TaxID=1306992 RepID=A0AAV3U5S1_9ALTE
MSKFLVLTSALLLILSCTSAQTTEPQFYDLYKEYRTKANAGNLDTLLPAYFTKALLSKGDLTDQFQRSFFLFENSLAQETSHFEVVKSGVGCLTVNGYDTANRPVVFSLEYVSSNEAWLINEMHVIYSEDQPMTKAICPDEYGALD